ncbi:hypothetical protein GCM10007320_54680 [Pseudorhodoferax aquiterrae]|uniref:O-antigen ligase-related domain-containing protein n=1 Tax=Pseudorhodoferax aquiterrae TaxID=747304 RepID=A0ABQ3G9D9_9BURK|nr:hypothetical protein GCM10007320_54680 [Pseudorhodoferax aquiterrae]
MRVSNATMPLPGPLLGLAACATALLPASTLVLRGSANRLLFLLLVLALVGALWRWRRASAPLPGGVRWWPICVGLALPLVAAGLSTLAVALREPQVLQDLKELDTPLRLALLAPILWLLRQVPARWLKLFEWGCVAGAVAAAVILTHRFAVSEEIRPNQILFTNLLPFSGIAMLLGLFSLISIGWSDPATRAGRAAVVAKMIGAIAGLYVLLLSGARGSWLALALLMPLLYWLAPLRSRTKLAGIGLLLATLVLAYHFSGHVRERIDSAYTEVIEYRAGHGLDSSVGNRLQLWTAAWVVFQSNPILGVSRQHYGQAMVEMARKGWITPTATGYRHSHNEFLFNLATLGIVGGVAILAVWLVPAWYFFKAMRHGAKDQRIAGLMGLLLALGFLGVGLTEVMFATSMVAAFYCVMTALLLALAYPPHGGIAAGGAGRAP